MSLMAVMVCRSYEIRLKIIQLQLGHDTALRRNKKITRFGINGDFRSGSEHGLKDQNYGLFNKRAEVAT